MFQSRATLLKICQIHVHGAVRNAELLNGLYSVELMQIAGLKDLHIPPNFDWVEFPKERRKLPILMKVPQVTIGAKNHKSMKRTIDMRGPERVHNQLIHKQYGIQALKGGALKWGHFEMIRLTINRKMDEATMFARWRVDGPWKSITSKGLGHRMGNGKGSIDHFVTPVKADRIIIEVGGNCEFSDVKKFLHQVARILPFEARAVSQDMLLEEQTKNNELEENNLNPFDFKYMMQNNFNGIKVHLSRYDWNWYGKYK